MPNRRIAVEFEAMRSSVLSLARSLVRLAAALDAKRSATAIAQPKRTLRLTPARRAALKLQGQYMGYMRGLRPRQRAEVKALRVSKGVPAAIALAQRLAKSA